MSYNNGENVPFFNIDDDPFFLDEHDFDFRIEGLGTQIHAPASSSSASASSASASSIPQFHNANNQGPMGGPLEFMMDFDGEEIRLFDETNFDFFIDDTPIDFSPREIFQDNQVVEEETKQNEDITDDISLKEQIELIRIKEENRKLEEEALKTEREIMKREKFHKKYRKTRDENILKSIHKKETCDILDETISIIDKETKKKYELYILLQLKRNLLYLIYCEKYITYERTSFYNISCMKRVCDKIDEETPDIKGGVLKKVIDSKFIVDKNYDEVFKQDGMNNHLFDALLQLVVNNGENFNLLKLYYKIFYNAYPEQECDIFVTPTDIEANTNVLNGGNFAEGAVEQESNMDIFKLVTDFDKTYEEIERDDTYNDIGGNVDPYKDTEYEEDITDILFGTINFKPDDAMKMILYDNANKIEPEPFDILKKGMTNGYTDTKLIDEILGCPEDSGVDYDKLWKSIIFSNDDDDIDGDVTLEQAIAMAKQEIMSIQKNTISIIEEEKLVRTKINELLYQTNEYLSRSNGTFIGAIAGAINIDLVDEMRDIIENMNGDLESMPEFDDLFNSLININKTNREMLHKRVEPLLSDF